MSGAAKTPVIHRHAEVGQQCCDPQWEAAYARFETPEQEVAKFTARLRKLGVTNNPTSSRCAELFCGRGGGLVALESLGFRRLVGVDLSETLLQQYQGPAVLHLADCRDLPLGDESQDAVVVQGGLHHLPELPDDLEAALAEINRVISPAGHFYLVEPWLTPFLRFVHAVVENPLVRKLYSRGDALATMIERERDTYERWLQHPSMIDDCLTRYFIPAYRKTAWGKLYFVGKPRKGTRA